MDNYSNYFQQNRAYSQDMRVYSPEETKLMNQRYGKYITPGAKILEIGTGMGGFANFCLSKGVKNYTGIEVDTGVAQKLSNHFQSYTISSDDVFEFFEKTDEKFDVTFMAHVLEHFTIEEGIRLAQLIREHTNPGGVRINIMPNAGCISGSMGRYNDITHKVIYTTNSMNQLLLQAGWTYENIQHFNVLPNSIIKKLFFRISGYFLSIKYNTFELLTIVKADSDA